MDYIKVFDSGMHLVALLDNAMAVGYELKQNDIATAVLTLPAKDPNTAAMLPRAMVELHDGERDAMLFRVLTSEQSGGTIRYNLEHVCATLMDECLPGFLTIGGTGVYTADVITALLARQTTPRWVLGQCDFNDQYEYTFENTNLLTALYSIGKTLSGYKWVWDTSVTPWQVSLKAVSTTPDSGIVYRRNLSSISKMMDSTTLITRIYPRGSGEGTNQVNIKSVNNGVEYLDCTPLGGTPISTVYCDTSIEDPETLKAVAQNILNAYSVPYYTYTVNAIDISGASGYRFDMHLPGDTVRVIDDEDGITLTTTVVSVKKDDVRGQPCKMTLTLANAERDAADTMAKLSERVGVTQLYSQGATNLYSQQFADNASGTEPAKMRFYVPSECVRINKVLLSWDMQPFRAYSKTAAAAGAISVSTTLGGETSLSGGGQTLPTLEVSTSAQVYSGTQSAGYTSYAGGHDLRWTGETDGHKHSVPALGTHHHTVPSHYHTAYHSHTIPDHTHDLSGHTHTVTASAHTHSIVYGIYEGSTATKAIVKIDGVERYTDVSSGSELDVSAYLAQSEGRITRGTWHEIEIVPNSLTRIEANLFVQLFIQSRGGGDY